MACPGRRNGLRGSHGQPHCLREWTGNRFVGPDSRSFPRGRGRSLALLRLFRGLIDKTPSPFKHHARGPDGPAKRSYLETITGRLCTLLADPDNGKHPHIWPNVTAGPKTPRTPSRDLSRSRQFSRPRKRLRVGGLSAGAQSRLPRALPSVFFSHERSEPPLLPLLPVPNPVIPEFRASKISGIHKEICPHGMQVALPDRGGQPISRIACSRRSPR